MGELVSECKSTWEGGQSVLLLCEFKKQERGELPDWVTSTESHFLRYCSPFMVFTHWVIGLRTRPSTAMLACPSNDKCPSGFSTARRVVQMRPSHTVTLPHPNLARACTEKRLQKTAQSLPLSGPCFLRQPISTKSLLQTAPILVMRPNGATYCCHQCHH